MGIDDGVHPNLAGFEEEFTGFCTTIGSDHAYIHAGLGHTLPHTTASLAAAAVEKFGFTTPAASTGKYIHWRPSRISGITNAIQGKLYWDTDYSSGTLKIAPNRNNNMGSMPAMGVYTGVTAALAGRLLVSAEAGGGFANQPAGDGLEIVSSDAADIGQIATIYGTITGTTATITTESIALNGTDAVSTTTVTWQNILGIELSASCAGTVTIREASGNQAITTILTTVLSAGVSAIDFTDAKGQILTQLASDTSTAPVGVIGTTWTGAAMTSSIALNGATPVAIGAVPLKSISKVLIGAVAANRTVTITRPEVVIDSMSVGSGGVTNPTGGGVGANEEIVLEAGTKYVFAITNVGAVTATTADVSLFWYEENRGA